jgi:hypothetical protein
MGEVLWRKMSQATYEDVNLILKLYEMRREEKMRAARAWFLASCKPKSMAELGALCPPGYDTNAQFRMVTSYWDMAASFITAGVLNQELFFESNTELLMTWERVRPVVGDVRAMYKNPHYLKNLETVGDAFAEHMKKRGPETYEAFLERVVR